MDHDIQLMLAPKDIDVTYQDHGIRHLLQNPPIQTEQFTHYHQMHRDYIVQEQSFSNSMAPPYAQTYQADTIQQQFNNREVHQEMVAPPHDHENDGKKECICKFCQKVFLWESGLNQHLLIHTGENLYVCEYCTRRFNQKGTLKRHRLTHTGEKPYLCTICMRSFAQKYNLTQHLLTHTREKKHICEIGNTWFNSKNKLNCHYQQHSENSVFKQKKPNTNTEIANKQVPNTELEQEQQRTCMEQQRSLSHSISYLVQTVPEHCGTSATDSKSFQDQASISTGQLGSTENTQSFVPIDQSLVHMVPQYLNHGARGRPVIKTVAQQNIAHSVPHVLRQIEHPTLGRNGYPFFTLFGQAVDAFNNSMTPEVYQNIGAQSYNHLMTADQKDIDDLGYKGMDRLGIGVPLESIIEQSTTATHNCGTTTYHLPCALNDGCHFKKQKQTSTHAAFLTL